MITLCRTVTNAHVLDSSLMRLQIVQKLNKWLYAFGFFDNSQGIIREEFIGFAECSSTTGDALTNGFLQNLRAKNILIENMRRQG